MAFDCNFLTKYFERVTATQIDDTGVRSPANYPTRTRTSIVLPTFDFHLSWPGASFIAVQYNYNVVYPFSLPDIPTLPNTFCLVIRYQSGTTAYRYKLNTNTEKLDVPLYNNEIIDPVFCFEVWRVQDQFVSNTSAITFYMTHLVPVGCPFSTFDYTLIDPQDGQGQTFPISYNQSLE